MESSIIVAIIAFFGTLIGTFGGIVASAKLIEYRLGQLEKKVEALSKQSADIPVLKEKMTNIKRRVSILEKKTSLQNNFFEFGQ